MKLRTVVEISLPDGEYGPPSVDVAKSEFERKLPATAIVIAAALVLGLYLRIKRHCECSKHGKTD